MLIVAMGAPGTGKEKLRKYLLKEKFEDYTPELTDDIDSFYPCALSAYINGLSDRDEKDIVLSRSFFEHWDVHIPAWIAHGITGMGASSLLEVDHIHTHLTKSIVGPDGIFHMKNEYISASNEMQMHGHILTKAVFDDMCKLYDDLAERLNAPVHTIQLESVDIDFESDVVEAVESFRREMSGSTIWKKERLYRY